MVWLYAGLVDRFGDRGKALLNEHDLLISPIVRLELRYLYEIGRVTVDDAAITADLAQRIGLRVCSKPFDAIVTSAATLAWTRDPFDRIIVAHAALGANYLLSQDRTILQHYPHAIW